MKCGLEQGIEPEPDKNKKKQIWAQIKNMPVFLNASFNIFLHFNL